MPDFVIRPAVRNDLEVLWDFLAMAAYEPDAEAAKAVPSVAKYFAGWKRPGDLGFIADQNGEIIGTAWAALFRRRAQGPLRGRRDSEGVDRRETECARPRRRREAHERVDRRGRSPRAWP